MNKANAKTSRLLNVVVIISFVAKHWLVTIQMPASHL